MITFKEIIGITFMLLVVFSFLSCEREEDNPQPQVIIIEKNNDQGSNSSSSDTQVQYYVKYEMSVEYERSDKKYDVSLTYTSDTGEKTIHTTITRSKYYSWDGTFGPFNKTQTVKFDCISTNDGWGTPLGSGKMHARIYVKQGNGPFAVKAEGESYEYQSGSFWVSSDVYLKYELE